MAIKVALSQCNVTVGDLEGNGQKLKNAVQQAKQQQINLIVFPELAITGYPPEDLLLRPAFIARAYQYLEILAECCDDIHAIVGLPLQENGQLMNTAAHLGNKRILGYHHKHELPNYGVFDEKRYFSPGNGTYLFTLNNTKLGIGICEDFWQPKLATQLKQQGAELLVSINASPFEINKSDQRVKELAKRAQETSLPILYTNLVGGQDGLVFDGGSLVMNHQGKVLHQSPSFAENTAYLTIQPHPFSLLYPTNPPISMPEKMSAIEQALTMGIRDYVDKNHFEEVLIGLSGGIDSAVALVLACQAVGSERVTAVMMPSVYTSDMSLEDAKALANQLRVTYHVLPIQEPVKALEAATNAIVPQSSDTKVHENLQARCRGTLLMALSNATNGIVLITGNRSEFAVGYATLYGDMAGGFAVLKDLPKTLVYALAHYINQQHPTIPQRIIDRPPTAELRPEQTDQDSLPPYEILDKIIALHIDQQQDIQEIVAQGYDKLIVQKVVGLIHRSEYKRRQAPPGIRLNHTAFGPDRRYPITSGYDYQGE